jgi:hypothetical protein
MTALHKLAAAIDAYLASLAGPGIAETRARLLATQQGPLQTVEADSANPCLSYLSTALTLLRGDGQGALADAVAEAAPLLTWVTYDRYPQADIGAFATQHAFASLAGEGAPFAADDFDLGLFLIAPGVFYRDHQHAAPELYVPLTGPHGWRFEVGAAFVSKPAHEPVWNPPWQVHATQVGDMPFLCLFSWLRDVQQPARICF